MFITIPRLGRNGHNSGSLFHDRQIAYQFLGKKQGKQIYLTMKLFVLSDPIANLELAALTLFLAPLLHFH